jgi:DNA-binding MarR family transcriptional regulator
VARSNALALPGRAKPAPTRPASANTPAAKPGSTAASANKTVDALDRVIHERIRLGLVSALAVNDSLSFTELKTLLGVTDGNLSVHSRKLEEAGYISCTKGYDGRVPKTEFRLTAPGRRALEKYLAHMEALIQATRAR